MSLAQVAYTISTDADFAAEWNKDPRNALAGKGFELSQEEFNFLSKGLRKGFRQNGSSTDLSDLVRELRGWN